MLDPACWILLVHVCHYTSYYMFKDSSTYFDTSHEMWLLKPRQKQSSSSAPRWLSGQNIHWHASLSPAPPAPSAPAGAGELPCHIVIFANGHASVAGHTHCPFPPPPPPPLAPPPLPPAGAGELPTTGVGGVGGDAGLGVVAGGVAGAGVGVAGVGVGAGVGVAAGVGVGAGVGVAAGAGEGVPAAGEGAWAGVMPGVWVLVNV